MQNGKDTELEQTMFMIIRGAMSDVRRASFEYCWKHSKHAHNNIHEAIEHRSFMATVNNYMENRYIGAATQHT